jgi:hypothetical protein
MLRPRLLYALLASLAVIAAASVYLQLSRSRDEAPAATSETTLPAP